MKHLLLTTIAAARLVGCGESPQSSTPVEAELVQPVAEARQPEPPTAKARDISLYKAAEKGDIEQIMPPSRLTKTLAQFG